MLHYRSRMISVWLLRKLRINTWTPTAPFSIRLDLLQERQLLVQNYMGSWIYFLLCWLYKQADFQRRFKVRILLSISSIRCLISTIPSDIKRAVVVSCIRSTGDHAYELNMWLKRLWDSPHMWTLVSHERDEDFHKIESIIKFWTNLSILSNAEASRNTSSYKMNGRYGKNGVTNILHSPQAMDGEVSPKSL